MFRSRSLLPLVIAACVLSISGTGAQTSAPRVSRSGLALIGSFRVPHLPYPQDSFDYGGAAISYNPARNSLFMVGHVQKQLLAEISIPGDGAQSQILQPLTDALEGQMGLAGDTIGGTLVWGDRLVVSTYVYYDGTGAATLSHFVRPINLGIKGQVIGPARVGSLGAGFYGGPMAHVPSPWQALLGGPAVTGLALIPIISRTSLGPSAHAFNPSSLQPNGAASLVYYPIDHATLGDNWVTNAYHSASDMIGGMVIPEGTSSVLFFGRHGSGQYCYGEGFNTPSVVGTKDEHGNDRCYDPLYASKGPHTYPYTAYVWAYDANDLAAVRGGQKKPWDVRPYDAWPLPLSDFGIVGAAYDPATARIYLSASYGDGNYPLVAVMSVSGGGQSGGGNTVGPNPPTNLRIVR